MVQSTRHVPPRPLLLPHNYSIQDWQIRMARWEIHKRAGNLYDAAWWRWMPGTTISVAWPVGKVFVVNYTQRGHNGVGAAPQEVESADPNDHYRPWLEKNVGRQGWDWNWGLRDNNVAENRLTIKICRSKAKWASAATLLWG